MEVGGLQRSATSFRRQGSSGLVWDDKFLAGENNDKEKVEYRELRPSRSVGSTGMMQRSNSNKGARTTTYRTVDVSLSPNVDPPSPKVSGCGLCVFFGQPQQPASSTARRPKSSKR